MFPSRPRTSIRPEATIITGTSSRTSCCATISGVTKAATPRMKSTLKMLLPTTLPSARSAWPLKADITLTANSGALVPKATTVSPMTSGEIPHTAANREAPFTSHSALTTSRIKPSTSKPIVVNVIAPEKLAGDRDRPMEKCPGFSNSSSCAGKIAVYDRP